jgi:hypothetical protein
VSDAYDACDDEHASVSEGSRDAHADVDDGACAESKVMDHADDSKNQEVRTVGDASDVRRRTDMTRGQTDMSHLDSGEDGQSDDARDASGEDDDASRARASGADLLVACPCVGDALAHAVPMCGPYSAFEGFR